MSAVPRTPAVVDAWSARERQEAARTAYLASVEAGRPLTGKDLGRQFGRTDRWGRMQIRKFRAELDPGNRNGNGRAGRDAAGRNGTDAEHASAHRNGVAAPPGRQRDGSNTAEARQSRVVPLVNGSGARARKSDGNGHRPGAELSVTDRAEPIGSAGRPLEPVPRPDTSPGPQADGEEPTRKWLDSLITLVVALVCAAASFGHMYHVALLAGEPVWIARAWPVTVDGLVLAALRRGQEGRLWLALGIAVSMAANVLAQFPELAEAAGPFVSAWPPVALYGTHRLLHGARRRPAGGSTTG